MTYIRILVLIIFLNARSLRSITQLKRSIDHIDRRQVVDRHMAYGERTRKKKMRAGFLGWYEQ
jgi:hypothetical protein